jgi:integrase
MTSNGNQGAMGSIHRLSQKQLATAEPGWHCDGGNLYLLRKPNGSASWVFRFKSMVDRREHMLGIGKYPEVDLAKARKRALEYRTMIADGVDLYAEHRRRRRDGFAAPSVTPTRWTFEACAREFIRGQNFSPDNIKQWTETLQNHVFPAIGKRAVDRVELKDVERVLKPIWSTKYETARRLRERIERILDWAKVKKLRDGDNPARWDGNLEHILANGAKKVNHHRAVAIEAAPDVMAAIRAVPSATARALELLALTATRTNEVRGARFGEFDLKRKVWTIPATRTKTRIVHPVPLSPRAVAIVKERLAASSGRNEPDDYVFTGAEGGMLGANQMGKLMDRLNAGGAPHGWRSTFKGWAGRNGVADTLSEMCLAHLVGNAARRAYARDPLIEPRRKVMDAWSEFCGG